MSHKRIWKRWILIGLLLCVGLSALGADSIKQRLQQWQYQRSKPTISQLPDTVAQLPEIREAPQTETPQAKNETPPPAQVASPPPAELNLDVPFTSQAPLGTWDDHTKEYCEEASVLMVARYFDGRGIASPNDALAAMQQLEAWQNENLGYFTSTTTAETASMIEDVYGLTATVLPLQSIDGMKVELADGALVILPAAGQQLGNPYFQRPGPVYHMLVVKGYTNDGKVITNDPGTRRGADFVYDADTLFNAVGDYNDNDPTNGAKVMIVVKKRSSF